MILESPESILRTIETQAVDTYAAGTDNSDSFENKGGRGNLAVLISHGATASGHTLGVTVQHSDDDTTFVAVQTDAGADADFDVAASAGAGTGRIRVRRDRLKRYVRVAAVVVGGSGVDLSVWAVMLGDDSPDCDGAAAYEVLV